MNHCMGNRLKSLRGKLKWSHQEAADAMGVSRSHFIKLERGERRLNSHTLDLAAGAFGVSASDIIAVETVPVVGKVRAGDSVQHIDSDGDGGLGEAPAPENAQPTTVAVEIDGDSLGPAFNGWYLYYDAIEAAPTPAMLHRLCVVGLPDGRVMVKTLRPGSAPGLFNPEPQFGTTLYDQPLAWAARVTSMTPK